MIIIEKNSGNIVRITDVFTNFTTSKIKFAKGRDRKFIKPVGFIVGTNKIYLTTDHGRMIVIDTEKGNVTSLLKMDSEKISRPFILNQMLFIISDNSIIKLD